MQSYVKCSAVMIHSLLTKRKYTGNIQNTCWFAQKSEFYRKETELYVDSKILTLWSTYRSTNWTKVFVIHFQNNTIIWKLISRDKVSEPIISIIIVFCFLDNCSHWSLNISKDNIFLYKSGSQASNENMSTLLGLYVVVTWLWNTYSSMTRYTWALSSNTSNSCTMLGWLSLQKQNGRFSMKQMSCWYIYISHRQGLQHYIKCGIKESYLYENHRYLDILFTHISFHVMHA